MRFWNGPALPIVDELGYLPLPAEAASHLSQLVSRRYEHGSIILTTNRGIATRGEIFQDTTVAAAILDRPLHHGTVLTINGPSYGCAATTSTSKASARASKRRKRATNPSRPPLAAPHNPSQSFAPRSKRGNSVSGTGESRRALTPAPLPPEEWDSGRGTRPEHPSESEGVPRGVPL
jgi:hypothetical protein